MIEPPTLPANVGTPSVNLLDASDICRDIHDAIVELDCYVALTGGTLYKHGKRKDVDVLFYRVRQKAHPPRESILAALREIGFIIGKEYNWCTKSRYKGIDVDLFFPELNLGIAPSSKEY